MTPDAAADRVVELLKLATVGTTQLAMAVGLVDGLVREAVSAVVREVAIDAPGVVIVDRRTPHITPDKP